MRQKSLCTDDLAMIEKYSDMVYRMAYSMVKNPYDAEDIHQDVFVKYIGKKPVFESEEHAKAWFLRVTINLAKNFWKTAWKQRVVSLLDSDWEEREAPAQEEDTLIEVVKRLPQKYRTVIHLFYYEELSVEEMAGLLKEKPSTIRTWLTRARRKLKEWLKEDDYVSGSL